MSLSTVPTTTIVEHTSSRGSQNNRRKRVARVAHRAESRGMSAGVRENTAIYVGVSGTFCNASS